MRIKFAVVAWVRDGSASCGQKPFFTQAFFVQYLIIKWVLAYNLVNMEGLCPFLELAAARNQDLNTAREKCNVPYCLGIAASYRALIQATQPDICPWELRDPQTRGRKPERSKEIMLPKKE